MAKITTLLKNQTVITLILLFIIGIIIRFLYFPDNIYFGYDQARDAFISLEVLHGKIKIAGPTTSIPGFNHGALFYYLYAPIYFFSQSDPTGLAIFLKFYNAFGIFLIFLIAKNLFGGQNKTFGKRIGIISAILYTFSYEQSQYSLFMTHPALAVITVLTFYLGLSLLIFQKKAYGLPLALLGMGLSFQFHFLLFFLIAIFILNLIFFWKKIPRINLKTILFSIFALAFSFSTFIIAEIKFGFKSFKLLIGIFGGSGAGYFSYGGFQSIWHASLRYVQDNFFAAGFFAPVLLIILLILAFYYLRGKNYRDQMIFLLIWFLGGLVSYFINDTSLYFYGIGTSLSLIILASFILSRWFSFSKLITIGLVVLIIGSNLYLIKLNNSIGPNKEINVQTGMLLSDEKKAIDYMYEKADGQPFAVNGFTLPLEVNTTWAYLFGWYGQRKYGYQPVWGGVSAPGYEGNLEVNNNRSSLPDKRFLITEPTRGSEGPLSSFLTNEGWFTDIIEEKRFGEIIVDYQKPK